VLLTLKGEEAGRCKKGGKAETVKDLAEAIIIIIIPNKNTQKTS